MAENLNLGRPSTNPASGQSGTRTRERRIASPTRWPLGHGTLPPFYFKWPLFTTVFLLQHWRVKRPLLLTYILLTKLFQLDFLSERLVNLLRFSFADVLSIMFLFSVTNLPLPLSYSCSLLWQILIKQGRLLCSVTVIVNKARKTSVNILCYRCSSIWSLRHLLLGFVGLELSPCFRCKKYFKINWEKKINQFD